MLHFCREDIIMSLCAAISVGWKPCLPALCTVLLPDGSGLTEVLGCYIPGGRGGQLRQRYAYRGSYRSGFQHATLSGVC